MRGLLSRLFAIGADSADDADLRLRKALVLAAVMMVVPAASVWGAVYWSFDAHVSALVPWIYVALALVTIPVFGRTRRYDAFAATHFVAFLVLPFLLMWSLGGFIAGSVVALWAWLSPLAARAIGHRRASFALFVAFSAGIALSALIGSRLGVANGLTEGAIAALFTLNIVVVGTISMVMVDASSGGREGSLEAVRTVLGRYFSPDVAQAIVDDPGRQALGGETADVTILFADLGGYTAFSDQRSPHEVMALLNAVFGEALPVIRAERGTPVQLPGDAVMAIFGAPRPVSDHPQRAARAALAIQSRVAGLSERHPEWPRFRIGINTGEAVVGNIGSDEFRNFTAIGDTVNMAQRFCALAAPGQVVTGRLTTTRLGDAFVYDWLAEVSVKGKAERVQACVIRPGAG